MSTVLAIITALGVVAALLSNMTNIVRYLHDRRERAEKRRAARIAAGVVAAASSAGPTAAHDIVLPTHAAPPREPETTVVTRPLPAPLTSFVGRAALLSELVALLRRPDTRLVTLHGPGGIGKSRLALEACAVLQRSGDVASDRARFDGVAFVALDALRDPDLLATKIARDLGVIEVAGISTVASLLRALEPRRLLLVLDNFEGLLEAAPLVSQLLVGAPLLTVLVTSRTVLRLTGELAFPVPPMGLPPEPLAGDPEEALRSGAVRLFVERARAVRPDLALDEETLAAIVEIARRVDGLPLALELAAARTRTLAPPALLGRMTQLLPMLTAGPRDAPERQRTLRDTIDWSYALLTADEQRLLARLAVFDGGADLASIEAVLGATAGLLDDLASLRDKSLLQQGGEDDTRFGMLETVREYAEEHLRADPELPALERRHAEHFLAFALKARPHLTQADQATWLARLRLEEANLRLALEHLAQRGPAADALRLAAALRPFWMAVGTIEEGRRRLADALRAGADEAPALLAPALAAAGVLAWRQGDLAGAQPLLERSLRLFEDTGERSGIAGAKRALGILAHNRADYPKAEALLHEALALYRDLHDDEGVANALLSLGNVALDRGDDVTAARTYAHSRAAAERIGDVLGIAYAVDNLSVAAWYRGDDPEAERLGAEALALYERIGHQAGGANIDHRRGLAAYNRADLDAAERHLQRCLRVRRAQGDGRGQAFVLYDLARVALRRGRPDDARRLLHEGMELACRQGARVIEVLYLEGVAAWLDRSGEPAEAYTLLLAARAWRDRLGVPVAGVNRERQERLVRRVARSLSSAERARAEELGRTLAPESAVARARDALAHPGGRNAVSLDPALS